MSWRAAMVAAVLATIGHGRWWIVALAAFLVRGGLLVVLPAVVIAPTPARLAVLLDPSLTGAGVGNLGPALATLLATAAAAIGLFVVGTGLIGAWFDAVLIAEVAVDEELEPVGRRLKVPVLRGVAVRLIAHVPTLVASIVGLIVLGGAAYAELLSPSGPGSLVGRVVLRALPAVVAMAACWLVGEAWGGTAMRRLGRGARVITALIEGLRVVIRPSGLATLGVTTATVAAPVVALWLAAGRAFERLWPLVVDRADPSLVVLVLGLLVGTWAAGLWLIGIALAWRSAAWTAEDLRWR